MIETTQTYKDLLQNPNSWKETRLLISGEEYKQDRIVSVRQNNPLFAGNTFSIGGAVSATLDVVIRKPGLIPKMAEIKPFFRLTDGETTSEWVPKGVFFIDTRRPDNENDILTIRAFDAMLRAEQIWEPDQSLTFPMSHRATVIILAQVFGVKMENPEEISDSYYVDYPTDDYTIRQVLRFIAGANGGNFVISNLGNLRFVGVNKLLPETRYLVDQHGNSITFGGVRILV